MLGMATKSFSSCNTVILMRSDVLDCGFEVVIYGLLESDECKLSNDECDYTARDKFQNRHPLTSALNSSNL